MKPTITVIIPYYNAKPWIARCACSLRAQEEDFEAIFVNDHSTDGSLGELLTVPDDRFVLLENYRRNGVSGARNTGLDNASGEWVTFLDADDELLPGALSIYADDIQEGGAIIYQENHLRHYAATGATLRKFENPRGIYTTQNLPLCWFGVWNKIYKREPLQDIRFDESLQFGEDEIYNIECLEIARVIRSSGRQTVKHNIENMQSLTHVRKAEDLIRQLKKLCEIMEKHEDPELRRTAYNTLAVHVNESWYEHGICDGE